MTYKEGDWLLHEWTVSMVKEMNGEAIQCVSTGAVMISGNDLRPWCVPLILENKQISDSFEYWYEEIRKLRIYTALNVPDIHRYMVGLWLNEIYLRDGKNLTTMREFFQELRNFSLDVSIKQIDGVRIIR